MQAVVPTAHPVAYTFRPVDASFGSFGSPARPGQRGIPVGKRQSTRKHIEPASNNVPFSSLPEYLHNVPIPR